MATAKVALLIVFAVLYFGISLLFLGKAFVMGEVTSMRDVYEIVYPINSLINYNDWLKSSYDLNKEYKANIEEGGDPQFINEQEMGLRNANFGIIVSVFAILVFISAIALGVYVFLPNKTVWLMAAVVGSVLITHFFFKGISGIMYVLNGAI